MAQMDDGQMPNGLVGGQAGPSPDAAQAHGQMLSALQGDFSAAKLKLKKLSEASRLAEHLQKGLDQLVKQGDAVSPDDVIDSASDLVAKGASPQMFATLLADMPSASGVGLSGWLAQQDQIFKQRLGKLEQAKAQAEHELAASSFAHLIGHSIAQGHKQQMAQQEQMMAAAQQQNALGAPSAPAQPTDEGTP